MLEEMKKKDAAASTGTTLEKGKAEGGGATPTAAPLEKGTKEKAAFCSDTPLEKGKAEGGGGATSTAAPLENGTKEEVAFCSDTPLEKGKAEVGAAACNGAPLEKRPKQEPFEKGLVEKEAKPLEKGDPKEMQP